MMNENEYDIVIIGTGPAGICSALQLQNKSLKIAILDDCDTLGGQIYKNVQANKNKLNFTEDYLNGLSLVEKLDLSQITYINNASVWNIDLNKNIYYSKDNVSVKIHGKKIIMATGSMERPFPVKGWTLSGVLGATAAQIVLKESGDIKDNAVFVGTGPLFYYVISQYIDAGAKIKAIIDTNPKSNYFKALPLIGGTFGHISDMLKGLKFFKKFKEHGIPMYKYANEIEFIGDDVLQEISFHSNKGFETIKCEYAFVHQGLVPNLNLQLQVGCSYEFSKDTRALSIITDEYMESSVKDHYVIGDGKKVRGVEISKLEGKICALKIKKDFKLISDKNFDREITILNKELKKILPMRRFLDTLYYPCDDIVVPKEDEVIVCRCEEVNVKEINDSLAIDCKGMNSIKSFTRCGMGNCQSRFCGLTLLEMIAKNTNTEISKLSYLRIRAPIKPISLDEMSRLDSNE